MSEPTTATAPQPRSYARFFLHPSCDNPTCRTRSQPLHLFRTRDGRGLVQCCSASCAAAATEEESRRD